MDEIPLAAQTLDCPRKTRPSWPSEATQVLFQRTLAAWASDLLLLQRDQVTHLIWRRQDGELPLAA